MAAVTLAVQMENDYLGFDFAEEMVAEARLGDVVTLTYDFGAGARKIVGTFMGRETRDSGETFVWVEEQDSTHTRYAIPMGMVEGLRIEARAESLPMTTERIVVVCDDRECGASVTNAKPDDLGVCPRCGGSVHMVTNEATAASIKRATPKRARAHRSLTGETRSAHMRACARLDYEGTVGF